MAEGASPVSCQPAVLTAPVSPSDAVLLNNIVQNFGMLDLVKKVLAGHKCQMDRSREQYARDLAGAWGLHPWCGARSPRRTRGHLHCQQGH